MLLGKQADGKARRHRARIIGGVIVYDDDLVLRARDALIE